jgi:conjugative transfer signal peptidase TraF
MALRLSNPLKLKTPGSYELRDRLRRAVFWACLLALPFFLGLVAGWVFGIRLNLTPSLPLGFYITNSSRDANLVEFCPQGEAASISLSRQYRTAGACPDGGAPLLKPVVAFPGDQIKVSADGIRVNGQLLPNSAGRFRDHLQRPLDPTLSPPAVDVHYRSSSAIALRFPPLPARRRRLRGAGTSRPYLSPSWLRCSSITRNPESTPTLRCSATTRRRPGRSSPERALSLDSTGRRS